MKKLLLMLVLAAVACIGFAQVSAYTFGYSTGAYSEITGGTAIGTTTIGGVTLDNVTYPNVPIPFFFPFNGRQYNQVTINSNGYIVFGGTSAISETAMLSSTAIADGVVAIFGKDNKARTTDGSLGEIRCETLGSSPNQIFVIQWKNFMDYGGSSDVQNYQIRLYETTKVIQFVYGNVTIVNAETCLTGFRGLTNADFLTRTTTTDWAASTLGAANTSAMAVAPTIYPASGAIYTFTPPAPSTFPNLPTAVSPLNPSTGVFPTATLNWADGGGWTESFRIYFGTTNPPPVVGNIGYVTSWDPPGDMALSTPYYWKVEPYNTIGGYNTTQADPWTFTTSDPPLTGTKTIGGASPTYATFTDAINALNGAGVGTGGVIFEVRDGTYNENPPAITVSGTSDNQIKFLAATGANPVVSPTGGTGTFGFKLNGVDWVTFDNIDVNCATNTLVYGYWLAGLAGNGATNNTIKNCAITVLAGTTTNYGIYSYNADSPNSYCTYLNNSINNLYNGIYIPGNSTAGNEAQGLNVQGNTLSGIKSYGIYMGYAQASTIQSNTIGYSTGATSTFYVIYTFGSTSSITVNSNMINGGSTSSTVYALYNTSGNNVYTNNSVSNLINTGTSGWYGMYNSGGDCTWTSNSISNIANTGNKTVYAMYSSSGTVTWTSNSISNITLASSSAFYGLYASGTAATFNLNTVSGVTNSSTGSFYGAYLTTGTHVFNGNLIYDNQTGGTTCYGIYVSGGTTHSIYNNQIYNLRYSGTGAGVVSGLYLSSATNTVYNNMIYDLKAPTATTAPQVRGITVTAGTLHKIYYNSMLLDAVSTATNFGTACLYTSSSTSGLIDLRNNIFVNRSTPRGTGLAVAIHKSTTGFTVFGADTDRNLYYAGSTDASHVIGLFNTTAYPALADYRAAAGTIEQGSYTEENTFFRSSVSPYDLRIAESTPTQVESGGANVTGITTDMYGTIRQGNPGYVGAGLAPDLGANEGEFTSQDLAAPVISYTPLNQTISTGDRDLTGVIITDATGIDIEGGEFSPRIYYTLEPAGTWYSSTGTFVSGTSLNSVWDFAITAADFGGLSVGDVVYYYVIAQDTAPRPNVGSMPAGAVADDVNNITTHPANPYSYLISPSFSGDIQVGTGQTYTSLTADDPAGLFKTLNGGVITDNINVVITSDLTETGAIGLNQTTEAGIGNYTITIKPGEAVLKTISGSYASNGLIRFNDADRITIDGRFGGSGRYLTIANTSTTAPRAINIDRTSNGAQGITIRNCNLGTASKTAGYGIYAGGDSDNLTITDNFVPMAGVGIYVVGTSTNPVNNLTVTGNVIGNATDDVNTIGVGGIYLTQASDYLIQSNQIENILKSSSPNPYGITLGASAINGMVSNNTIDKVVYTGTGGYGAFGIDVSTDIAASNVTIANNMISRMAGDSDGGGTDLAWNPVGIRIAGTSGGLGLYYNSVMLSWMNNTTAYATDALSAALYVSLGATNLDIRNNIFYNNMYYSGTAGIEAYAVYSAAANTAFTNINNNDYFVSGTQGILGYLGADKTTLSAWRTATGQDGASVFGDPQFTSTSDLHLLSTPASWAESKGTHLASYPTDIEGDIRWNSPGYAGTGTGTDIGADEGNFTPVTPAVMPAAQPTNLVLIPGSTTVNGSFTAAVPPAEAYLVVASTAPLTADPVNEMVYTIGAQIGGGTVAKIGDTTSFSSTGLSNSTLYYYTVFSYNTTGAGAPLYLTTSPLVNSVTTLGTPPTNPASVVPTAIATDQISVVIQANAIPNNVLLAYSMDGIFGTPLSNMDYEAGNLITGGGTVLASGAAGTYLHTSLSPFTKYYYKAWSVSQDGIYFLYSAGIVNSTFTWATIPLSENFDGVVASAMPMGWTKLGTLGSVYTSTTNPLSPLNCLYLAGSTTNPGAMMAFPPLDGGGNYAKLSFWARGSSATTGVVDFGYLTTPNDQLSFVSLGTFPVNSLTYTQYMVGLGQLTGVKYYAIRSNVNTTIMRIDDIAITLMPSNDLAVSPITGSLIGFINTPVTHTITISNLGSATQNSYDVNLKRYGDDMLAGTLHITTPLESGLSASHDITWTPTSLWGGSLYGEVIVTGDGDLTNNTSANFTFGVYPIGAFVEDFESGAIPNDWTIINSDGDTYQWDVQATNPHTGTYHARCHWNSSVNNDWLITPPLQVTSDVTGDQISFWIGKFSNTYPEDWQVLISTTDTNIASFTMIDSGDIPAIGYIQKTYNLDSYGDAVIYLAIRYVGTNDLYFYADDFVGPLKYVPQAPVVNTEVLGAGVKLTWPAVSHARSYQILAADDPYGTFSLLTTVTGTEYTITAPEAKKFYKVLASTDRFPGRSVQNSPLSREAQIQIDEADAIRNNKNR